MKKAAFVIDSLASVTRVTSKTNEFESAESQIDVVVAADNIINKAIAQHASDIHLESMPDGLRVRYRLDGVLYDQPKVPAQYASQLISRIKVLSSLNTAERRAPQDGKFCRNYNNAIVDIRVSTFPTISGEKMVLRVLDRSQNRIDVDQLGLPIDMLAQFHRLISKSSGFILVTGPTGSGKTTTLYAALAELAAPEKHIVTLEDPAEYMIEGITQGQIHPEAGFTFERGIRAMLRQDPDVVMIGEIRDKQTAHIAIEAALTGHLVLSTLHTTDAPGAIMRLMDMGIEPFLINAAVTGVIAQRLARKICRSCRTAAEPTQEEDALLKRIGMPSITLYKGTGCDACFGLGYKGRIGIFELLEVSPPLRDLIVQQPHFDSIYQQVMKDGMQTLLLDACLKVKEGIITLQELARILL